ncbi:metallophosphoesterase [Streptococcus thoraltensis]|uniref:metallophosphoesterase n=1 Tax=Streptococcus thoraltensis TaxID=55085 RepID=UPI002A80C01B|nr:metallophosphoesterase [Streptococcus thoraltensis]MDY4761403.1 metallophosphoesterase [Streptococcus thoraltensis]
MSRKSSIMLVAVLFLASLLTLLNWKQITGTGTQKPIKKVWVVTDLHLLSPALQDNKEAFKTIQATAAGKDLRYGKDRMEALLVQAKKEKPDLLVVSGDLTFNGEYQSLKDLSDIFKRFEQNGIQVLVEPGNHDISDGWAREFRGKKQYKTKQLSKTDFETLMADFGYEEADTRDSSSLTYLAKVSPKRWFLMIDSNIYVDENGSGAPVTNGRLKKATLDFIEQQLEAAQKEDALLIPVMHHNVLNQHRQPQQGYALDNAPDLRALYAKYGQKLALSGHIHTQNIERDKLSGGSKLTEIVTGAFSISPASIGELTFGKNSLHYRQKVLDMKPWLKEKELKNKELTNHRQYMDSIFNNASNLLVHMSLHDEGWYDSELAQELSAIIAPVNLAYFTGQTIDKNWLNQHVYQKSVYQKVKKSHPDSFVVTYIEQVLEESSGGSDQEVRISLKKQKEEGDDND